MSDSAKKRKRSRFGDKSSAPLLSSNDIKSQIDSVQRTLSSIASIKRSKLSAFNGPLILNKDGMAVDKEGKVVDIPVGPVRTLSINKPGEGAAAVKKPSAVNPYLEHMREGDDASEDEQDEFVDESIVQAKRERKGFKFVPAGKYIKLGTRQRERDARKAYQEKRKQMDARRHYRQLLGEAKDAKGGDKTEDPEKDAEEDMKNLDAVDRVRIDLGLPTPMYESIDAEPALMEWWDIPYLPKPIRKALLDGTGEDVEYDYSMLELKHQVTHKLIEHPPVIKPLVPAPRAKVVPLYLTKKERKKKRRQARMEAHQEMQDKVQMGLIPPPKSKVKMSNMMKVLQNQAVSGPSAVSKEVLEGIKERRQDHEMRNLAAKKTPAEKWAKKRQKIQQDSGGATVVAVFKVDDLCTPPERAASLRFKLDVNAQKLALTGSVIAVKEPVEVEASGKRKYCNLVIVEGGEKRIHKFEKLMKRLKWDLIPAPRKPDPEDSDAMEVTQPPVDPVNYPPNTCTLVWKGFTPRPVYSRFFVDQFDSPNEAKKSLQSKSVGHYWDMACQ